MKIKIDGYRGIHNNTVRIENKLSVLGHQVLSQKSSEECELLVNLNGPFDNSELYYKNLLSKPIRLYVLLDIDIEKDILWYNSVKTHLEQCEIPCAISNTVSKQIKKFLGISRGLNILRHPIKPVSNLKQAKGFPFLYSGRVYSKNKRFDLVLETLHHLGYDKEVLVVTGTEKPPIDCVYVNSPDDNLLNEIYNAADFLLSPSEFEGQNCNMIQAVITRTFPILNNRCDVVKEFGLSKFACNPDGYSMATKVKEIKNNCKYYLDILSELRPEFEYRFSAKTVAQNILDLYNAYKRGGL